jgi:wyosine [tRNA(Phe)-imidazoG37] synthetase (radical SAM superfamily)
MLSHFSDLGESTLAKNMDLAIEVIRKITNIPLVVITNSNLMKNKNV